MLRHAAPRAARAEPRRQHLPPGPQGLQTPRRAVRRLKGAPKTYEPPFGAQELQGHAPRGSTGYGSASAYTQGADQTLLPPARTTVGMQQKPTATQERLTKEDIKLVEKMGNKITPIFGPKSTFQISLQDLKQQLVGPGLNAKYVVRMADPDPSEDTRRAYEQACNTYCSGALLATTTLNDLQQS
eukprot:CAMPEP_0173416976 /NCGR_PEP_ID=MMETSP1356-20130122/85660_1 /TAXON_ID=77927 ORGANISM="Hemiselmis virescens, Strain PCC157" /NCGR_SAMPLE_ID=MMETSP1356 /ASSEMBLY_ACC=CAM_ASM_000847 /LENGTH=184 /DNA_ID=CAMNT_0014379301 /DNA_START=2305 /DNA_END=2856 /DNA_ORIENTATION=+